MATLNEDYATMTYGENATTFHDVNMTMEEIFYINEQVFFWQVG